MKVYDFQSMKENGKKISMITCYDYWSAFIVSKSQIDCVLVGDSLAMVVYGHTTTIAATVDIIAKHIQAVAKGVSNKFIVGDMPFCSYRKNLTSNMISAEKLMRSGADAIKLEGVDGNLKLIHHIVKSGIPVMGHLGLTPQSIHTIGGFKVQGKDRETANKLKQDAKALEDAGCFALVLECIPYLLAKDVTNSVTIPTVGIGAGPYTSGQILVLQDLLGMNNQFTPKYLKKFLNGFELIEKALNDFNQAVKSSNFPSIEEHSY
ncbi:3-methyl-2-oxobutanoate hydroxymethyltransferase [Coxiella endosymbiont of Amblyomma americanum]|uniref:3-methyl-2-oxobutanoate hydroxymethyltransferase n=1 Tax=Coxiella endosymbiont of Amblyomma americanum TaxID=325775 RepID=UPI00057E6012|nr:3-methyl-2-oxobutanoate hydroxymethyltransferase [Coxiella endosymbiont of Amblyomma americanum]AJC50489.1 3-methyl-2-oxobutanoate hydroxymethyltransferase [Coxiella endosymbiont of Amblyomma americanum]AUJ59044.1 3-methyl-2-oxobutanoate hydroxymethyltransferase [Coxiella-like endosymbiont of Amblyomma americanum]